MPLPSDAITAYAVEPLAPHRIYVTDGRSVLLSTDGGCDWSEVFSVSSLPNADKPVTPFAQIKGIEIALERAPATVFLLLEEEVGPARRVHVLASSTGGESWELRDEGLPAVSGSAVELEAAPADPSTLYLLLRHTPGTAGEEVYASDNGGRSWTPRGRDQSIGTVGFDIDPLEPRWLWLWGAQGLSQSTNGGASVHTFPEVAPGVSMADVFHEPGRPPRVMAYELETSTFNVTRDGGLTWSRIGAPRGFALSMTHGADPDHVVVSVHEAFYRFNPPRFWIEVARAEDQDLRLLSADATAAPAIYGLTDTSLVKYTGLGTAVDIGIFGPSTHLDAKKPPRLTPQRKTIRLRTGREKVVPYELRLPAASLPLDVFFLVDTTQSMTSTINGLRHGMAQIVKDLAGRKIDVNFGVGEYKDYPTPGYGDPLAGDFPYRRLRAIGPPDASLAAALEDLQASGGGDIPESQLTGLYQAVTGAGERGFVPPGQDADFRPGSLRTIVNITDAQFNDSVAHPAPPFQTVADTLEAAGVLQIGLAIFGPNGVHGAAASLRGMASATGTVAPGKGVDCDRDGVIDVAPGEPLVCEIRDEVSTGVLDLAPAILATLRAVTETAAVELVARGGEEVVASVRSSANVVNLLEETTLGFEINYRCPHADEDSRHKVLLAAKVGDKEVDSAVTRVSCMAPSKKEPADIPPVLEAAPPVVPITQRVIVPPPQAPPEIAVQPPNFQAQGAVAQQRQQQAQVALVHAGGRAEQIAEAAAYETKEHSFSSLRRSEGAPTTLYGAGAAMALAYAAATMLSRRTAVARNARRRGASRYG